VESKKEKLQKHINNIKEYNSVFIFHVLD